MSEAGGSKQMQRAKQHKEYGEIVRAHSIQEELAQRLNHEKEDHPNGFDSHVDERRRCGTHPASLERFPPSPRASDTPRE